MRTDLIIACILAVAALMGSVPVSLMPVLFPKAPKWFLTSMFYGGGVLTVVLFSAAFYIAIGIEDGQILRSKKMTALILMTVCALGFAISMGWFLSQSTTARAQTASNQQTNTQRPIAEEPPMPEKNYPSSIDNRITNSPIVNSPGSVQAPGGNVTINQGVWLMTGQEQQAIIRVLQSHAPSTIHLLMIGDSDARKYASQIAYAIDAAKWHVELVNYALMMPGVFGVNIMSSDPEIRATLVAAFKAAGIQPTTVGPSNDPQYLNAILVGLKP